MNTRKLILPIFLPVLFSLALTPGAAIPTPCPGEPVVAAKESRPPVPEGETPLPPTPVNIPGGLSFYAVFRLDPGGRVLGLLRDGFPAFHQAFTRLTGPTGPLMGQPIREVGFFGRLQGDTVFLALRVEGTFDRGTVLRAAEGRLVTLPLLAGYPLYRQDDPGNGGKPIHFILPQSNLLLAGQPDTLREIFGDRPAPAPPRLLQKALAGEGSVKFYFSRELFTALLPPAESPESYRALRDIFNGLIELSLDLDPVGAGQGRLWLQCTREPDAAGIAVLLKSFLSLCLLAADDPAGASSGILRSVSVQTVEREVRIAFSLPPPVFMEIVASPVFTPQPAAGGQR